MLTGLGEYLKASGVTYAAFATEHGLPSAMVYQWASGYRRPGRDYAVAIEHATGGAVPVESWSGPRRGRRHGRGRRAKAEGG